MKKGRGWWKKAKSDVHVSDTAPAIRVGQSGRPAGPSSGPSRAAQQQGGAAAAAGRRAAAVDGAEDAPMHDEPSARSEHYVKASNRQAAWKEQMPELKAKYYDSLPTNIDRAQQQAENRREQLQLEVDDSWTAHTCSASEPATVSSQPDGQVTYYGLDCVCTLNMPRWTCQCCHQSFSPHPLAFGCFPSTPVTPHIWYDLKVLQLYKKLGPGEGLSATAFLGSLSKEHKYWSDVSKDLVTSKFEDTFCAFLTMDHELESLHSLGVEADTGPFGNCPICAHGPEADDQEYKRSADLDAVTKTNHFRKCATSTQDIPPNLACSFAGPEADVRDLERQGKLNLKSFVDTDSADGASPDDDNIRACSSSLHCARPEAPAAAGLAAAMTKFRDHTLRGKGEQGPDDWTADYVEEITRQRELASLRGSDAGLAVVNSAMASLLLVKAYSKKEAEKNEKALFAMEQKHTVTQRWSPSSAAYQLGLELLRKRTLMSLEERISLAVREIQDKRAQKLAAGPSTKLGQSLKRAIGSRKAAMMKQLDERSMWLVVGTQDSVEEHQLDSDAVKKMLRTGDGPWESGAGSELYWGKLAHRCTADLARCKEELPDLGVQKMRLGRWAERTLHAVEERLGQVGEGSGKGILLRRWKSLLDGIIQQLSTLKW